MRQLTVVAVGVVLVMRADGAVVQVGRSCEFRGPTPAPPGEQIDSSTIDLPEALDPSDDMDDAPVVSKILDTAPLPADVPLEQVVAACLRGVLRATNGR